MAARTLEEKLARREKRLPKEARFEPERHALRAALRYIERGREDEARSWVERADRERTARNFGEKQAEDSLSHEEKQARRGDNESSGSGRDA